MEMAVPVVYILTVSSALLYDDHSFGINPNSSVFVLENDSGWIPKYQENYVVQNIGRSPVDAQLWYGDEIQWFGIVCGATIFPGETKVLNNEDKIYYVTGLKILNNNGTRAIIHADGGELPTPYFPGIHFDPYKLLRKVLTYSIKYIPGNFFMHKIFKELLYLFWPENHPNIWKEIAVNIKPLLQETELEIIESLLQNQMRMISEQIKSLNDELDNIPPHQHYMHLVYSLIGFEENFRFTGTLKDYTMVNFYILPLYTNFVCMKINFYLLGIRNQQRLNLTDNDLQVISTYANNTFVNASKYIKSMLKEPVDYAYNTSDAQGIFNSMMTVRNHLAVHGEEFLPIWKYQLENPFSKKKINNNVMVFSTFFGKPTTNLFAQATLEDVPAPLTPKLIDGVRDKLIKIKFYLKLKTSQEANLAGISLYFRSGEKYRLGTKTIFTKELKLGDVDILKLTAYGENKIEGLTFHLSDNRTESFGTILSTISQDFELPHHRIASLYLDSDKELIGQAVNIAVSYQWNDL